MPQSRPRILVVDDVVRQAVLYAGPGRITITAGGEIGLHQANNPDTGQSQVRFTTTHARALQAIGLPKSAADGMIRTSPDDIYIMTPVELSAYGVKTS